VTNRTGASPTTKQTFFLDLKVWSEIKHRILTKYFDAYCRIRGNSHQVMYYVDGFAGSGVYVDPENELKPARPGSPVLMADFATTIAATKPYRLKCINVELDPDFYKVLATSLATYDPTVVSLKEGSFSENLPSILADIGNAPAVFFLDPFGVVPLKIAEMAQLLARNDTELLVNVNTPRLRQLAGFEDSRAKEAEGKLRLVDDILEGSKTPPEREWLVQWRQMQNPVLWERWAVNRYGQRLLESSQSLKFAVPYPIRDTFDSSPKYYLLFLTRSEEALVVMNDLLCIEDENLFATTVATTKSGQASFMGIFREHDLQQRLIDLGKELHEYGSSHQRCPRREIIKHFVTTEHFGDFKTKHYRQVLGSLVKDGLAEFTGIRRGRREKDDEELVFNPLRS